MVRFLRFYYRFLYHKSKKTIYISIEEMQKALEQVSEDSFKNQTQLSVMEDPKNELKTLIDTKNIKEAESMGQMRKSVSLGSDLVDYDGRTSGDEYTSSHNMYDENQNTQTNDSLHISSNMVNQELGFSMDEEESRTGDLPHSLIRSKSSPFLDYTFGNKNQYFHRTQSSEAITSLEKYTADDSSDSCNYMGSVKDWVVPAGVDESSKEKIVEEDYEIRGSDRLDNKEFKIKRIEKWVMDLHYTPLNQTTNGNVNLDIYGKKDRTAILDCSATSRTDTKVLQGMDAAKKYISSLSGSSSAAHLANHGLVAIPFLSPFVSLKELSLAGNAIVRITTGILPKGLHILNLSKNHISVIEGLRELTRLRALDLSYNRILRIGHGLAACSSLKELFLAGNKISEVEGLHRLLKLKVLDLRFNKLSTTKSLGQLAANYNSLLAIGLEGNPAQKNVGDENLKKYLTSLLPHLAYYNTQSISGSIKDPGNRAAQLGLFDRGLHKSSHGRKSQAVSSRSRHVRLPPSGMKTVTVKHHHDFGAKRSTLGPDAVIRRTRSEGILLWAN